MSYYDTLHEVGADAEKLELAYQQATREGQDAAFAEALNTAHAQEPDNLLYAAWYYRLLHAAGKARERVIAWSWLIPLAILNGLLLWALSDDRFMIEIGQRDVVPHLALLWAPISALSIMLYLTLAGSRRWTRVVAAAAGLVFVSAYVLLTYRQSGPRIFQEQYLNLMAMHLPLLAWSALGILLLYGAGSAKNRFAFLIKSLEAFITGGLFLIAGALFTGITFGLFQALSVEPPDLILRLLLAGGAGLIPVFAVAIVYDPAVEPAAQAFDTGVSKLIGLLMRVLLPLTLLVLVIYLAFIPFNFQEPFNNRDVLIIYNGMLFAVMALLVGATPVETAELSHAQQTWLRRGIIGVAALAILVGLYALTAIGYRTWQGRFTPNRLTFIGWNVANIGILALLLLKQIRAGLGDWLPRLQSAFAAGMLVYAAWALIVTLSIPWLFRIEQGDLTALPTSVQRLVEDEAYPILLKCSDSPHIYLLEGGDKRWVQDIPTFESEGFYWRDVRLISCEDLRTVPDGAPIPRSAGPPPTP